MRVTVNDDALYNLQDNEYVDIEENSLRTGENWSNTFKVLARRHIVGNAPTLWCDLFALSMLFNQQPLNSQLLIVPCYFEISGGMGLPDDKGLLRFTVVPPQAMSSLEPTLPTVAELLSNPSAATPIIVLPVLMYDQNPHLLMSEESVYPLFYSKTSADYLESLDADLKQKDSMVTDHSLDNPITHWSPMLLWFDSSEIFQEKQKHLELLNKSKETAEDELQKKEAEELKRKADELKKKSDDDKKKQEEKEEKEKMEEKLYQENKDRQWMQKPKKLFSKKISREVNDTWLEGDREIDKKNPKYMYVDPGQPWTDRYLEHEEPPTTKWWNEAREGLRDDFIPDEDHIFDKDDLEELADTATEAEKTMVKWPFILQAATSMKTNVRLMPQGLDRPYTDQEFVDLACLLDPGRGVECDTYQKKDHSKVVVMVDSYKVVRTLAEYNRNKRQPKREERQNFEVYKSWLKKYLDYYNPGFYEFFDTSINGTKVRVVHNAKASNYQGDNEPMGEYEYCHDVVPLPKNHRAMFLDSTFVSDYASATTQKDRMKRKRYAKEYESKINPSTKFDFVPFPKTMSDADKVGTDSKYHIPGEQRVPAKDVQITAVKAEITRSTTGKLDHPLTTDDVTIRWLGLQDGKYVGVPLEWVDLNVGDDVMAEAVRRGMRKLRGERHGCEDRFVRLPPGDTREDQPPTELWNSELGLSYYCQEMMDNCLMGGFANAVCSLCGENAAEQLLNGWNPFDHPVHERWQAFFGKVTSSLSPTLGRVQMQKLKGTFSLKTDDNMPIVLQLKGRDGSETHAITVYQGNIYDSASKHILKKTETTLNWCCGPFGFDRTLRCYVLVVVSQSKAPSRPKNIQKKHRNRVRK
jgi:hypothetical protein